MSQEQSPVSAATATLLLVRHAETADNLEIRLSGWTDTDLSPKGEAQVVLLARHFNRVHHDVAALYASPLTRARRTAEAIGALIGLTPTLLDDLREMNFGDLEGQRLGDLRDTHGSLLRANEDASLTDFAWPGGESRSSFSSRVADVVDRICTRHAGQQVAIITHGGVIATFLAELHGEAPAAWRKWVVPNASLSEVVWNPASHSGRLLRHGDATHLAELTRNEEASAAARPVWPRLEDA